MNTQHKNIFNNIFKLWSKEEIVEINPLAESGSNRKYFRLIGKSETAIGVYNPNEKENIAFLTFAEHFVKKGLPVPKVYQHDLSQNIYMQEDLGDQTLFNLLQSEGFSKKVKNYYEQSLSILLKFQIEAGKDLNYSVCYPRDKFDEQSILWDLNYFKYYFLKLAEIQFDEQTLENDFHTLSKFLLETDTNYFMYRDFQARNIMIKDEQLYFIDFQGGRKGALQYDPASLLWSARANLSFLQREELLNYYYSKLSNYKKINEKEFKKYYYGYVLIRILQTLGAYGFRGFFERKKHFLKSIPFALDNVKWLLENSKLNLVCKELFSALKKLINKNFYNIIME